MSDPLYRKDLLRLAADAVGAGRLERPDGSATAHNPACGDRVTIDVGMENGRIATLAHQTRACVLTQASAAILGAHAVGLDEIALKALTENVAALLSGGAPPSPPFQDYGVFDGVPLKAALEAVAISGPAKSGA
jgi:NifU-like protein involved in Fe-S cluster formation